MSSEDSDSEAVLAGLKEFQRRTVEYVFRRMYLDAHPAKRFLIADEVGLGKTMVARGLIAKAIEHLTRNVRTDRIDIVYVCSNAAIARQNINRLNLLKDRRFELATRLTLLPTELHSLKQNDLNFVSFTPSTTFDLKSRGGRASERLLLFHMLRGKLGLPRNGLSRVLRGSVQAHHWSRKVREWDKSIEASLHASFLKTLESDSRLLGRLQHVCQAASTLKGRTPPDFRNLALDAVGSLRATLARSCVGALQPDLIILDEFQRFRDLIDVTEPTEAAQLAQTLMGFQDKQTQMDARVLLLSATPYRMYTMEQDDEDDHYRDFIETMRFLLEGNSDAVDLLERDLGLFRRGVYRGASEELSAIRNRIECCLRSVMVRTERVGATTRRDSMLEESILECPPDPDELRKAVSLDGVARAVGAHDVIEYWKSSPYLLNFMRAEGYKLKELVQTQAENPSEELLEALDKARPHLFNHAQVARYTRIDPGNARLRSLIEDTVNAGQWQWLWMPPSLPYVTPTGAYSEIVNSTKSLVFSAWNVVPDAISAICSYEVERRMLGADRELPEYANLHDKKTALLQFRIEGKASADDRMAGMTTISLFYPCATLARLIDPLRIALEAGDATASPDTVRAEAKRRILEALSATRAWQNAPSDGRVDLRWYWAGVGVLDGKHARAALPWVTSPDGWRKLAATSGDHFGTAFDQHLVEFASGFRATMSLGRPPDDLVDVLADLALAGPGVCAFRALERLASHSDVRDSDLLTAAAIVSEGLRTLFNLPAATTLLRGTDTMTPYWRHVLTYGVNGNLQAVLDEYFHMLRELAGHGSQGGPDVLVDVANAAAEALSLRTSRIAVDEFHVDRSQGSLQIDRINLRTRFALRFGEMKDDSGQVLARIGSVRQAFNSPFPPFVLASTSIGQEGLDFHCYCHAIYHWNLPSNPVDLEQREGRVHRYKGHAVRKNVAKDFGLAGLRQSWDGHGDPWLQLFKLAAEATSDRARDLIPYWIYETEGGAQIERRVPMLPLSREQGQLRQLKRGLALYRLVFGQPRQQELLEYLETLPAAENLLGISLAPD